MTPIWIFENWTMINRWHIQEIIFFGEFRWQFYCNCQKSLSWIEEPSLKLILVPIKYDNKTMFGRRSEVVKTTTLGVAPKNYWCIIHSSWHHISNPPNREAKQISWVWIKHIVLVNVHTKKTLSKCWICCWNFYEPEANQQSIELFSKSQVDLISKICWISFSFITGKQARPNILVLIS